MLKFENVTFRYPESETNILENISFTLDQGEWVTIVGPNGSGKSTLTKLICANYEASEGRIYIENTLYTIENIDKIREYVSIVFQNPDNQFVGSSVEEDVAFGLENKNIPTEEMEDIIVDSLKLVDMLDFRRKEPRDLSGGQKQRVAIASALAMKPKLLILDEATSMLDPKARKDILDYIKKINIENKVSIISISHDAEELFYSDTVLFMDKGKIVKKVASKDIYKENDLIESSSLELPFLMNLKLDLNIFFGKEKFEIEDSREAVVDKLCKLILKK